MSCPAWYTPIEYTEDRFDEAPQQDDSQIHLPMPADVEREIPGLDDDDEFRSTDTEPVDYDNGPHDEEFGVDEDDFESRDTEPIDYANGPHDHEFGLDDEDEE